MRNQLYGQEVIQQNKFYIFYYHSFQNLALPKYKNYKLINNNNFALNHPPPKNKETRKKKKELLSLFTVNQVLQFSAYLCVIPTGQNSSMISGTCKGWPWKVCYLWIGIQIHNLRTTITSSNPLMLRPSTYLKTDGVISVVCKVKIETKIETLIKADLFLKYRAPYAALEPTVVDATNQLHGIKWAWVIQHYQIQHSDQQGSGCITSNMWCMANFPGFQILVEEELQLLKPTGKLY